VTQSRNEESGRREALWHGRKTREDEGGGASCAEGGGDVVDGRRERKGTL